MSGRCQGSRIAKASFLGSSTTGRCRSQMGVGLTDGLVGVTTAETMRSNVEPLVRARLCPRGVNRQLFDISVSVQYHHKRQTRITLGGM